MKSKKELKTKYKELLKDKTWTVDNCTGEYRLNICMEINAKLSILDWIDNDLY